MDSKIPFYNILNMLLVGLVFVGCICFILPNEVMNLSNEYGKYLNRINLDIIIATIFFGIIYEIGFIITRVSSLILEELFIKFRLIPFEKDYSKYNKARKENPFLNTLSREYALARNSCTMFLILALISVIVTKYIFALILFSISILFFFSVKKHSGKIVSIINSSNS